LAATSEIWGDEDIDLRELIVGLWRRRLWIVCCMAICTLAALAYALLSTPIYRASTVLIATGNQRNSLSSSLTSALGDVGGLASLAGITIGSGDATTQEALAVLRSRQFTEQLIVDLNLMPELFAGLWDAKAGKWTVAGPEQPTLAKAFKYFDKRIRTVEFDRKTGLVTLRVDWTEPTQAAAWANEMVRRLNLVMRSRAIEQSMASLEFLRKELAATTQVETREAINRLIEAQIKQRMLANVTHEYAFRVVDPALPSDRDDPLKPNKLLLLVGGPIFGLLLGIVLVLGWDWLRWKETAPA
jgi:uncharacterized protein involved in exopolysaccharide biosynthesis